MLIDSCAEDFGLILPQEESDSDMGRDSTIESESSAFASIRILVVPLCDKVAYYLNIFIKLILIFRLII